MQLLLLIIILLRTLMVVDYQLVKTVDVEGDTFSTDPMKNVYVVKDNTLKKFSNQYVQAAYYTNTFLGNIYSVDVSDPLRILIFYKDYNQVVWVDNFLSEISSPIWLDDLGIDQVEMVCSSSQGGFWVFNSLNNQLQYFDVNLKLIHESPTLNTLTGPDISPSFMIEKSRLLYLNVPGIGILVFDRFGNYSKTLPVYVPSFFQVTDQYLYYLKEDGLYSYNLRTTEIAELEIPVNGIPDTENSYPGKGIIDAELQPGMLFIFTANGYRVYQTD